VGLAAHRRAHVGREGTKPPPVMTQPYVAACVMEPISGQVIYDLNMHKPWPPASMTKMMLMLIVAEKLHDGSLKLDDQVTASALATRMGGSQVYLKEGETFSLDDMMKAVVVHSANDAAVAVAEYVAGSTAAFVVMMNRRAAQLGMHDTHYYSVHGLPPGRGQQPDITSAYDSALLARQLIKYPDVLRWSAIDTAGFRHGSFQLRNTNHLIRTYAGCDGLKTGFYDRAGFNVTATAKRNGLRLIAVVLGSPRKSENFEAAATLLSQGFLNYYNYLIASRGQPIARSVPIRGGAVAQIVPVWGADLRVFTKRGEENHSYTIAFDLPAQLSAPVDANQQVGVGEVMVGGHLAARAPLLAPAAVARGSLWSRLASRL
ncbi:MAG TPA: D-alanyl-D-alanine carboxypeptidase family protein, partial [Candidatus Binataceae bacterium]|nr:D-alanyl-D-alanine carboxypeptidase family protein [Candidatus Binataceae bacterium]